MHFFKILKFWFPVVLYSGIIFYISSLPNLRAPVQVQFSDKLMHILEYTPFGFLLARAFYGTKGRGFFKHVLGWVLVVSFVYGLSDEYHQSFVIGRDSSAADALADALGGLLGGWLLKSIYVCH